MAIPITSSNKALDYAIEPAIIRISMLRLRTYIGFNPEEIAKKQDVIINASISYNAFSAAQSDEKHDALNYKTITKRIINHVEQNQFKLLEKLTADVLGIIMENPVVVEGSVTVDKPHALRFSDSVSLTLKARRP